MILYKFDGSFTGLLCCVFESFQTKESQVRVVSDSFYRPNIFAGTKEIYSDEQKAERVWNSFVEKVNPEDKEKFYFSFLAEKPDIFQHLFFLARKVFIHGGAYAKNFADPDVLAVSQMAKSVNRERHRMKTFINFHKATNGLLYSVISPKYNVIPLLQPHFLVCNAHQNWLVYDEKRQYGIFYDLKEIHPVTKNVDEIESFLNNLRSETQLNDEKVESPEFLWKEYFLSSLLSAEKNKNFQLINDSKRYVRYLHEN